MENVVAVIVVIALLAGILLFAKKVLKPPKGKLSDCCGPRGNRDIGGLKENSGCRGVSGSPADYPLKI
ncbi:MAG: hypothetical protein LBF60_02570 [Treponema sp.]|jgi:hypothetical protein|nr:hypothetical protein [Treponema sp.]